MRGTPKKSSDSRIVLRSHSDSAIRINIIFLSRLFLRHLRSPQKFAYRPSHICPIIALSASSSIVMMMKPSFFSPPHFAFVFCRPACLNQNYSRVNRKINPVCGCDSFLLTAQLTERHDKTSSSVCDSASSLKPNPDRSSTLTLHI